MRSDINWVNEELSFFSGNIVGCKVMIEGIGTVNVISVYSPAWPVDKDKLKNINITGIKLEQNPEIWCTEILWSALRNSIQKNNESWIISGDFNSSVTFDYIWSGGPHGNQEIIDRMNSLRFTECLYHHVGRLTPTFKNITGGKIIHQIDHLYVSENLLTKLDRAYVGNSYNIFEKSISDHLPIISEFQIKKL